MMVPIVFTIVFGLVRIENEGWFIFAGVVWFVGAVWFVELA